MATIREIVNKIRTSILGKDVREAIASGIEQCYEEASTARMTIPDGAINEDKLADGAVTNDKIATKTITADKIADGEVVKMVSFGNHVITDNNNRSSYPDISTIVKTEISNETSTNDQYPPTSGAVKRYLQSNAVGSMSSGYGGRARISLNGVTNYVPTMATAEPSGKIDYSVMPLADTQHSGAMSAADKEKLDSIDVSKLDNVSDISVETASTTYGYVLKVTIDGETYRIPYVSLNNYLHPRNIPTALVVNDSIDAPVASNAVYSYINGSASGEPGYRVLTLNLNGATYEIPILLATGKVGGGLIATTNTITSTGTGPVNGKAVYDYIQSLNIGITDEELTDLVNDWMDDNAQQLVNPSIMAGAYTSTISGIEYNYITWTPPGTSTGLNIPQLNGSGDNAYIDADILPLATTGNKGAMSAADKAKLDAMDARITALEEALASINNGVLEIGQEASL